jgi:BlaI family transcriptional regulator, penicillinase repressor
MNDNQLNPNELEALRVLWQQGESKPAQIQAQFSWPIENATLRSVLNNLVAKGHASRAQQGKAFFYSAQAPKISMLKTMFRQLAHVFANGSPRELVCQLIETADITTQDLESVRKTAAKADRKKQK